jgi:subtilisin family serine protease
MIGWTRIAAIGAALSVSAAACSPGIAGGAASGDLPPAPPVRELRSTEPVVPDDGLHRIVATIPRSTPSSPQWKPGSGRDGAGGAFTLTVEMLAALPDGASLVAEHGVLGYRDDSGELVVLGPISVRSSTSNDQLNADYEAPLEDIEASAVAERLASLPGVESVSAITDTSYAVTAASLDVFDDLGVTVAEDGFFALSGDPYEPYQWPLDNRGDNLDQLSLPSVPAQSSDADVDGLEARTGATGVGVVVAVVDSGVDFAHPDLNGSAWLNPGEDCASGPGNGIDDDDNGFVDDCTGWDFGNDDPVGYDGGSDAHGTHVAGLIAATAGNGIGIAGLAPDAEIMDLRVDSADGVIQASAIARAIRYAADNGADIVNLSLGSQPGASPEAVVEIAEAVEYAADKGVLLVVAAGNNATSLDDSAVYPASLDTANMIVVAASTPDDRPAGFSNTGSPVDVFAPGELVLSTVPGDGLAFHSGTSQAAPLVAAAAALVLEQQPGLAPGDVAGLLASTGDRNDSLSSAVLGVSRFNAAAAIGVEVVEDGAADSVTIAGLTDDDNGLVTATISLNVDGGQFNQPYHWEASLVTIIDGDPYAVTGYPVSTDGTDAGRNEPAADSVDTDERGAVYLAEKGASSATWSTSLPPGLYALVIEAVPRTDSTVRLGNAYLATFTVGDNDDRGLDGPDDGFDSGPGDPGDGSRPGDDRPGDSVPGGTAGDTSGDDSTAGSGDKEGDTDSYDGDGGTGSTPGAGEEDAGDDDTDLDNGGRSDDAETELDDRNNGDPVDDAPGDDASVDTDLDGGASDDGGADDEWAETDPTGGTDDSDSGGGSDLDDDSGDEVIELGPDRAQDGEWTVTDIDPRTGWVDTENLVQIAGTFPRPVEVWFDDNPGHVEFQSETLLVVRTGRHQSPGPVDVDLISGTGEPALTLPHAYAFLSKDDGAITIDIGDGSGGSTGGPDSDGDTDDQEPDFDLGPGDDPPTVTDGSGSGGNGPSGTDNPRSRNRQARAELVGDRTPLDNGLWVVRLDGLSAIGDVPACNEDPCRTRRI